MIQYRYHARPAADEREAEELDRVAELAQRLRHHLEDDAGAIAKLHLHNAQSKAIQNRVGSLLETELGFTAEKVLTADAGLVTRARPDFFYALSDGSAGWVPSFRASAAMSMCSPCTCSGTDAQGVPRASGTAPGALSSCRASRSRQPVRS